MDLSTESGLALFLNALLMDTAALDAATASTACSTIAAGLYAPDGALQTTRVPVRDAYTHAKAVAVLPTLTLAPLGLLYAQMLSFEIHGGEALRQHGTQLRNARTADLCDEGKALRQAIEVLGFHTDIAIAGEGDATTLTFTIRKESETMTRFMELWLERPTPEVSVPTLEELLYS
ncbi:MAG: hypothetical protein HUK02_07310 [Bacteroidaceae bacterium]|nr:hypothetical protein [Bacteroidaceae bacterium]